MKRFFTLFAAILIAFFSSRAQTITIEPASHQLHFNADDLEAAHSTVFNNSTATRTMRWVRVTEGTPAEWTSTVCDLNNCYNNSTSTMDFVMQPQSSGLLEVTVYANDMSGTGAYTIYVYDVNDSANANAMMDIEVLVESVTGIEDPADGEISIYPIPAKNVLNVDFNAAQKITSIEIYNVVGQKIKVVNVATGVKTVAIPVSEMKKGVYFVRLYSNGSEVMTKTFSKD
jgi:hypothetical protein